MEEKELFQLLFPEIRGCTDNNLESWLVYASREMVMAKVEGRDKWEVDQFNELAEVLKSEKNRRIELAKQGAPKYDGHDRMGQNRIETIRNRYVGEEFIALFQKITGFDVFPVNANRAKYRCTVHGEDKQPSGMLYLDRGRYYCFACGHGGDVFQLMNDFPPNLDFVHAVRELEKGTGG